MPELLLKQQIAVISRTSMIQAYMRLRKNSRLNGGKNSLPDVSDLESEIIGMFMHIKDMIICQTKWENMTNTEQKLFQDLMILQRGARTFDLDRLVTMQNYLLRKLHEINLTNLLIKENDPFNSFERSLGM